jgi:hypothetical protein
VSVPSYLLIENHAKERPEMILKWMNKNEERVPYKDKLEAGEGEGLMLSSPLFLEELGMFP